MIPAAFDYEAALARVTTTADGKRRLKAILPVHTYGQMADMTRILAIGARYGVPVIEDAACALLATWNGKQAGSLGLMGCFSFHPRKAVTTGEGGAVTTDDEALANRLRALRNHGQDPTAKTPDFVMPGFNCRMTEFQGAFGVTQLAKMPRVLAARQSLAGVYAKELAGTRVTAPFVQPEATHAYQSYVTLLPEDAAPRRAEIIATLRERGIETNIGTWHMPLTTDFRTRYGFRPGDFPVADRVFARAFTLPLYEGLAVDDVKKVVGEVARVVGGALWGEVPETGPETIPAFVLRLSDRRGQGFPEPKIPSLCSRSNRYCWPASRRRWTSSHPAPATRRPSNRPRWRPMATTPSRPPCSWPNR